MRITYKEGIPAESRADASDSPSPQVTTGLAAAVPAAYERAFAQEEFSYTRPTISSVAHPGPARVKTIHDIEP
jgi:hypothetical protein